MEAGIGVWGKGMAAESHPPRVISRKNSSPTCVPCRRFVLGQRPSCWFLTPKFYQEQAPGVGMDRAEILSAGERVVTPAGSFENCVHAVETSAMEKGLLDHKWYAPGVGQVKDAEMVLVKYGEQ